MINFGKYALDTCMYLSKQTNSPFPTQSYNFDPLSMAWTVGEKAIN